MQQSGDLVDQDVTFRLSPQQAFLLDRETPLVSQCAVLLEDAPAELALRAGLEELVARHEILRTTFVTPPGARVPVGQRIHEHLAPEWAVQACDDDLLLEDRAALEELLGREAEAARRSGQAKPVRARLMRLPGARSLIVVTVLAACADAASLTSIVAQLAGSVADSGAEAIQHADYAEWRAELLDGEGTEGGGGAAFWQAAREAGDPVAALLFGRPARGGSGVALRVPVALDAAERDAICAAASAQGVEPSEFALAAWSAVVARVSGAGEVLLAVAVDGRHQPDLADAIGPYAQPVPVGVRVESETSFTEVLDQVHRARREAERLQDHASDSDLAALVDHAAAGFSSSPTGSLPGLISLRGGMPPCAIGLEWSPSEAAELWADPTAYDRTDAEQLAHHLRMLLSAAAADPAQAVSRLPLLDEHERTRALKLGASGDAVAAACVHHAFEDRAHATPGLAAVASAGEELTFDELNRYANRLAHHLRELGAERDTPVALCLNRTGTLIAALLGILKAGAAYLPLNSSHPSERIVHQLAESGAQIVVTESALLDRLPPLAAESIVCLDHDAAAIAGQPEADPPRVNEPGDLAYVMYTSGSTGLPKGVAVTHGNLSAYTAAICERLGAGEGMQFASVSDISTDLGNTAIFPPLTTGGCLHVIDPQTAMDGAALATYARTRPLDVIKITPTHLRALLAAGDGVLPRRCLVLGGEALSWELVARIRQAGAGCRVLNHYGPTETTVGCCTYDVPEDGEDCAAASVPIGRPLPGARAFILDRHLEAVPVGVAGELCIAGAGVARGYLNRPEETRERFVREVGVAPGAPAPRMMYRTGDRARFLRDGAIEFLGRLDDQVKIRGFRVEPGEVEAVLRRHPAIREAAVIAHESEGEDRVLVAYLVGSAELAVAELAQFVGQSLPEHMVPSRFVPIDALPLTPSGKIDRRALPDPASVEPPRSASFVAPRDRLEEEIAAIWAQLLGVEEVGVFDDFFALGGHSLLATQAIMRVRRAYGGIPLAAMFNSPTVAALADVVRAAAA